MTDKPKWTDLFGIDPNYLEGVPEEPTLTASEVKVLTETATKRGVALGRKEAAEEFDQLGATLMEFANNDRTRMRQATDLSMRAVYKNRADGYGDSAEAILRVSRNLSSQASKAASDATSGVPGHPGHPEVSEAVRSPQEPAEPAVDLVGALRKSVEAARERRLAEREQS